MTRAANSSRKGVHVTDAAGFQSEFGVSRETADRVEIYVETLTIWQKKLNLVAPGSIGDVWQRHVADSAQIFGSSSYPVGGHWVDFGSGAGFPGMVVAHLIGDSGGISKTGRVTLVESDARKCSFLREVVRRTGLSALLTVDIFCGRIESPEIQAKVRGADVYSARAVASLERLLELISGVLSPQSVGVFPKGREFAGEIDRARVAWDFAVEPVTSVTDDAARVLIVRDLRRKLVV